MIKMTLCTTLIEFVNFFIIKIVNSAQVYIIYIPKFKKKFYTVKYPIFQENFYLFNFTAVDYNITFTQLFLNADIIGKNLRSDLSSATPS